MDIPIVHEELLNVPVQLQWPRELLDLLTDYEYPVRYNADISIPIPIQYCILADNSLVDRMDSYVDYYTIHNRVLIIMEELPIDSRSFLLWFLYQKRISVIIRLDSSSSISAILGLIDNTIFTQHNSYTIHLSGILVRDYIQVEYDPDIVLFLNNIIATEIEVESPIINHPGIIYYSDGRFFYYQHDNTIHQLEYGIVEKDNYVISYITDRQSTHNDRRSIDGYCVIYSNQLWKELEQFIVDNWDRVLALYPPLVENWDNKYRMTYDDIVTVIAAHPEVLKGLTNII